MSNSKIALITGTSRGLGLEIAKQLVDKGITVIVTARKLESAESTALALGSNAIPFKLDIGKKSDYNSVFYFIEKTFGKLDILVNNAGSDGDTKNYVNMTSQVSSTLLRETFDTNFFDLIELTQTLLPLLRKSENGRIINMSAILGSLTLQSDRNIPLMKSFAYNASKTALNAFTVHLADELSDTKIKVFSAHPGWVKTDHGTSAADLEIAEGAQTPVHLALSGDEFETGSFIHAGNILPW